MAEAVSKLFDSNTKVRTLEVAGEEGQLSRVRDFVIAVCTDAGFASRETNNTKLAVDEACTNIITHGYVGMDPGSIILDLELAPDKLTITLTDFGHSFEPGDMPSPDIDAHIEERELGGFGLFFIRQSMDQLDYRVTEDGNMMILTKYLNQSSGG